MKTNKLEVYPRRARLVCVAVLTFLFQVGALVDHVRAAQCAAPPSGLVSWWQAEGDATDAVGANNGSLQNGASITGGKVGQAFNVNGVNQYVAIPSSGSLNPTGSFSIEAWIYPVQSGIQTILAKWSNSQLCYTFLMLPNNSLQFAIADVAHQGDASFHTFDTPNAITLNAWSHVAAVYDQSTGTRQLYVNGAKMAERTDAPITVLTAANTVVIGARLASSTVPADFFGGKIDEVSFYSRALSGGEIAAIYGAGSAGKCTNTPPSIVQQPQGQSVSAGDTVSFNTIATGSSPIYYQWQFNGTDLAGATGSALMLTNVQAANAGSYHVVVTNAYGSVTSSNATLTVHAVQCTAPPAGLVSWWQAEGDATDAVGANNGFLQNGAVTAAGKVKQAFNFNGVNQYVAIPSSASLNPTGSFSIEAWIFPVQTGFGTILGKWADSAGCYSFLMSSGNGLRFSISDLAHQGDASFHAFQTADNVVPLNAWSHVAAVYDQSTGRRQIYLNGVKMAERTDAPLTVLNAPNSIAIGARLASSTVPADLFGGKIDEVSFYSRALSGAEVAAIYGAGSAGKCSTVPPSIVLQPQGQSVSAGSNATFSVTAAGSKPLHYQWQFNGTDVAGATRSVLTLTNVQPANAGSYEAVVTNAYGSVTSTIVTLTVLPPPSIIQIVSVIADSGIAVVPINLVAQGSENALGFSLQYDPALLTFNGAELGTGASGASLIYNTNQLSSGRLGIAISLPSNSSFTAGTQQLVNISFSTPGVTHTTVAALSFSDQPVLRQVVSSQAVLLAANYTGGNVTIPFLGYEGDVWPLPDGDNAVTIGDWVQLGRIVAGLDTITNASEYRRADCAPRSTLGNGRLTVSDWVQAGRYAAGLDPLTPAGGPSQKISASPSPKGARKDTLRTLTAASSTLQAGLPCQIAILLHSQGDENALGFSLTFDPSILSFTGLTSGAGASGATMDINTNQAGAGRLGVALAKPIGSTFAAGTEEVAKLSFAIAPSASGTTVVSFVDAPVLKEIADANASTLPVTYVNGVITVFSQVVTNPNLNVTQASGSMVLSWPVAALGYELEATDGLTSPSWVTVPLTLVTNGLDIQVSVPTSEPQKFYRLRHQ